MNPFRKLKAFLMYYEATQQADAAYERNKRRYFVMPTEDGKLVIMDRYDFKRLKRKHYMSKQCHVEDLIRECFYFTPLTADGLGEINPQDRERKKQVYYKWYDLICKIKSRRV